LTQVQRPDRGTRVKSPAGVRARGCAAVWARSPGRFCLGPVPRRLRRAFDPPSRLETDRSAVDAGANDGDSVRISRTNTPAFVIQAFVTTCWRQRRAHRGGLRGFEIREQRVQPPGGTQATRPRATDATHAPAVGQTPGAATEPRPEPRLGPLAGSNPGSTPIPADANGFWHGHSADFDVPRGGNIPRLRRRASATSRAAAGPRAARLFVQRSRLWPRGSYL
jgi:hypothetical protein